MLTAWAAPALAFPQAFELTGQEGAQPLSGHLTFDAAQGKLSVTVEGSARALRLEGKTMKRATGHVAFLRPPSAGLVGGLHDRVHSLPWTVFVQPKGLSVAVTLTRGLRRLELQGATPLDQRHAANEALIRSFYEAFARSDGAAMKTAYAPSVHFSDPVFPNLHGDDASDMWAMLCEEKPEITFSGVRADGRYGVARWVARYKVLGNDVVNVVDASFEFSDGKIVRHVDHFPFRPWARQAFGSVAGWVDEGALLAIVRHTTKTRLGNFQARPALARQAAAAAGPLTNSP